MNMSSGLRKFFGKLRLWSKGLIADRRGGIVTYLAVAMVPMSMSVGVALDVSRAYHARDKLSHALDAAGLAVGAALNAGEDPAVIFDRFMTANYPEQAAHIKGQPTLSITGSTIRVSAEIDMPTTFMQIAGFNNLTIAAATEIQREESAMEVALVLDNTGSMRGAKLEALRAAALDLVNILFGSSTQSSLLRISVVPYAAAVNPGAVAPGLVVSAEQGLYDPGNDSGWKGCVLARTYPDDVRDTPMTTGNEWRRYFYQRGIDNYWPPVIIRAYWPWWVRGPNVACPTPITPLTGTKATVTAALNAMEIWWGGTFSNLGMVWGWRVLSPQAPFAEGKPYTDPDNIKAAVLMTDGVNQFGRRVPWSPYRSDYTAYQYLDDQILGTLSYTIANSRLDARLAEVCTNMKAQGIIIYTITFALNNETTQNLYRQCASDSDKYFNSPSNEALAGAFRSIGNDLRRLHISK